MADSMADQDNDAQTTEAGRNDRHSSTIQESRPERAGNEQVGHAPAEVQVKTEEYSPVQRRLHWIVAALVAFQLVLGISIGTMDRQTPNDSSLRNILIVHLITGTVIFGLMCKRVSLRRRLGAPPSPEGTPLEAAVLARANHLGFYGLLLVLPVLGWLAYISERQAAAVWGAVHGALALVLVLAICAHLCGVIFHQYIRHDGLLRRMLG